MRFLFIYGSVVKDLLHESEDAMPNFEESFMSAGIEGRYLVTDVYGIETYEDYKNTITGENFVYLTGKKIASGKIQVKVFQMLGIALLKDESKKAGRTRGGARTSSEAIGLMVWRSIFVLTVFFATVPWMVHGVFHTTWLFSFIFSVALLLCFLLAAFLDLEVSYFFKGRTVTKNFLGSNEWKSFNQEERKEAVEVLRKIRALKGSRVKPVSPQDKMAFAARCILSSLGEK